MKNIVATVFDWAGTLVDFGSRAPMGAFVQVFREFGVEITIAEARAPMGRAKRDHIAAILAQPCVARCWQDKYDRLANDQDIDAIYDMFVPLNAKSAITHADIIPMANQIISEIRAQGIKIGSTTGYTRSIMENVLPLAREQGIEVDSLVCAGEAAEGRPSPMNMYHTFIALNAWPAWKIVKIDDTPVGIEEGANAGCWTVGLSLSGNETGLSLEELSALSDAERDEKRQVATKALRSAGASYVIDSVADLIPVLDKISQRIETGERP